MNYLRKTFLWILLLPYALGFLGAASNQLVFLANHGKFPVELNPAYADIWQPDATGMLTDYNPLTQGREVDPRHCAMTAETHLNWLADVFDFHSGKVSIGDLLINASADALPYCWGIWLGLILTRKEQHPFLVMPQQNTYSSQWMGGLLGNLGGGAGARSNL